MFGKSSWWLVAESWKLVVGSWKLELFLKSLKLEAPKSSMPNIP
ncbi:hypothetical protein Hanom_Chr04g00307571 [Helianthus anomalus]